VETSLKQRLIGAAVIVALAVIFIPMLFDNAERKNPVTQDMSVPPEPEYTFKKPSEMPIIQSEPPSRPGPRDGAARAARLNEAPPASANETPRKIRPVRASSGKRIAQTNKTDTANVPTQKAPEATGAKSTRAAKPVKANASAEQVAIAAPPAERLADKPHPTKARQPNSPSATPLPSSPPVTARQVIPLESTPGGWAVQVGSFSERDNAMLLLDQLRSAGFAAFQERANSGGQPVYRVKVGPAQNRARAEALQAKLRRKENLKGIVVSQSGVPDT
jgi:DedD protein